MNKYIVFVLLFFYGCGTLNLRPKKSIKKTILIHANIEANNLLPGISKIKTKIEISTDTITASVYPFLGVELGKLTLTKDKAVLNNKYTKENDSLLFKRTDYVNIKAFQKSFIKKTSKADTIEYKNPYNNCVFTNYVFVEKWGGDSLFLPQKIILKNTNEKTSFDHLDYIGIDYKSVNLF